MKNEFLRLSLNVFWYKWCAALSSVVLRGGPEGRKNRFNANVVWEKVLGLFVKFMCEMFENWSRENFPEYLMLRIHAFKLNSAFKIFVKLCGFLCLMCDFPEKTKKSPDIKNEFLRLFLNVFWYKWCAALSSVVLHGGPEGRKNRFNANVLWENILGLYVNFMFKIFENWSRENFPEYFWTA